MSLPDIKQLKKIIVLCRKTGVDSIEIDGVKITLGAKPAKTAKVIKKTQPASQSDSSGSDDIETEGLSELEALFWSSDPSADNKAEPI